MILIQNCNYFMTYLKTLSLFFRNLSNNNITAIQALDLSGLRDLKALDFSYNQLTAISEGSFIHLQQLEELDLHHNHINCIDPSGLSSLRNLRYL